MAQPTLILLTMFLLFSPAIDRGTASADENPPFDNAKPPEPKIKEIRVEKVRALKDNGKTLFFIMSMYGPYNTFVMKATLVTDD